jgi:hypothetical protein
VSVADSYVREDKDASNYGTLTDMDVISKKTGSKGKNARSLVQFDVSSIPAGSTITSATLTLCATAVPATIRTYEVYQVTAGWTETGVTWANQPSTAATATATATTPTVPGCMTWVVTANVQAWVAGTTANNGWLIKDQSENSTQQEKSQFRTRESGVAAERPLLDVSYTSP